MYLNPDYLKKCIQHLDKISSGVWDDLSTVPALQDSQSHAIVAEFLECACQSQNTANIQIGRHGLSHIPRRWILQNIELIADSVLDIDDEWEFCRLLEVYQLLDQELSQRLIQRGQIHPKEEIREATGDYAV